MPTWTAEQYKEYLSKGLDKKATPKRTAKTSPRKATLKKCDMEFSLLMRAKEADEYGLVTCCTCSKRMPWKGTGEAHWGHWQSRGFNSTRWNPMNGGVQCRKCNTYLEGRKSDMRAYLVQRYGENEINKVEAFSRLQVKYSEFELSEMAARFREERNRNRWLKEGERGISSEAMLEAGKLQEMYDFMKSIGC